MKFWIALLLIPLVFAECPFVSVSAVQEASVFQGQDGVFAVSVTNQALNNQLVYLSAVCPEKTECRFTEAPSKTMVSGEQKTYSFIASSNTPGVYEIPIKVSTSSSFACEERILSLTVNPYSTPVSSGYSVSLNPTVNQSARPGEILNYEFTISNNNQGVAKSFAQLSSSGFFDSVVFNPVDLDLPASTSKKVSAKIIIPPGTPAGVYKQNFRVRLATQDGVQFFYDFPVQVFVFSDSVKLTVQNEPLSCLLVYHNEELKWPITLRNDGESTGPFSIRIEGTNAVQRIASIDRELVEITPGDKQDVIISLKPSNAELLDSYYYTVIVNYLDYEVYRQDYCFRVASKNDFQVIYEPEYVIKRGVANQLIPFSIVNNGTLQESFSIEVNQDPTFLVQAEPKSFVIGPGRKQDVFLIAATSLDRTEFKTYEVNAIIRTNKVAKSVKFKITVVPDESNSYLEIQTNQVQAIAGQKTTDYIWVKNTKTKTLRGVFLALEGLNPAWYSIKFPSRDINAFDTAKYEVEFNIPSNAPQINNFNISVTSLEREVARKGAVLFVEQQGAFSARVDGVTKVSDRETLVTVTLTNNGDSSVLGVKPVVSGAVTNSGSDRFDLPPHSSKTVVLSLTPLEDSASVSFESASGVTAFAAAVPFERTQSSSTPWIAIALVALFLVLVAYFFWVKPQENNYY